MTNLELVKSIKTEDDFIKILKKMEIIDLLGDDIDFWYGLDICSTPKCPYYQTDKCPSTKGDEESFSCELDDLEKILKVWLNTEA